MDGWNGMERHGLEWIDRQMEMDWAYSLNMRFGCAAYFLKPLTYFSYFRRTKMGDFLSHFSNLNHCSQVMNSK